MKNKTIIVVGGQNYGLGAAARARQFNEHARIIWVEQSPDRPLGSFWPCLLGNNDSRLNRIRELKSSYDVEIFEGYKARHIDMDARCLLIKCLNDQARLQFDSLIFAGDFLEDPLPHNSPKVVGCHTLRDRDNIRKSIEGGARHATVMGLSAQGIEASFALKSFGLDVALIDKKKYLSEFSFQLSKKIISRLACEVDLKLGQEMTGISDAGSKIDISLQSEKLLSDLLVFCSDPKPDIALLTDAGASGDHRLIVDDQMRTSLPRIFACGLAISVPEVISGERQYFYRPEISLRTAQIAGHNAALSDDQMGESLRPVNQTLLVQVGMDFFARTGLSELSAYKRFDRENVIAATVLEDLSIRLIVEKKSQRIIGGEVAGKHGVKRRIDLISMAIAQGLGPTQLLDLDMLDQKDGIALDPLKEAAFRANLALLGKSQSLSADELALWLAKGQSFSLVDLDADNPVTGLRDRLMEIKKIKKPIVLYSTSGDQSFLAQQVLAQQGLDNAYHLDGGSDAWEMVKVDNTRKF